MGEPEGRGGKEQGGAGQEKEKEKEEVVVVVVVVVMEEEIRDGQWYMMPRAKKKGTGA